jgi:hypothetical protein
VIGRNLVFQANLVKQTILPYQPLTHHGQTPSPNASATRNHAKPPISTEFFNTLSHKRTLPSVVRHVVSLSQAGLAEPFDDAIKIRRILIG